MQLPNLARCSRENLPPADRLLGSTAEDQAQLGRWLASMMRFEKNSHLRGTCLLTGQQSTVDMTSNYKTSMIMFSSVNVVFMLAIVLWITASFALFYIGGAPRTHGVDAEMDDLKWTSDDLFMSVAMVWNIAVIIYMLVPDAQIHSNIPLNNVVIAVLALLLTIFVQWRWANFKMYDVEAHDSEAEKSMRAIPDDYGLPDPRGSDPEIRHKRERDRMRGEKDDTDANKLWSDQPGNADWAASRFSTNGFLSTANAVKDYGVQYAKYVAGGSVRPSTLRHRKQSAVGTRASLMPNYTAMIKTGSPIVIYNYIQNIKVCFGFDMLCSELP